MTAWSYYIATLTVYFGVNVLSALSLNLQFGFAGVVNFGYIIFQAVGAYIAAVVVLGPSSAFQQYVFGARLPFGVALLLATAAGAVLSLAIGLFSLRNIRRDYQAAILLIISLIATQVVQGYVPLFNGSNGVTGVPRPLSSLPLSLQQYQWAYAGWVLLLAALAYALVTWLSRSPWGRALRALRDQEDAAAAIGLNVTALRLQVFVIGGALAGLSGGLLVEYIGAWSPDAWSYAETFVIFTALFVGGIGNYRGAVLGVLLVPIIFLELPRFLPQVGYPGLMDSVEWIAIGAIWMLCLYLRPQGIVPERRNRAPRTPAAGLPPAREPVEVA
jgi:ABC-type branched-subunit amino acid transport system permease subunit